jgi:hypothetical protein
MDHQSITLVMMLVEQEQSSTFARNSYHPRTNQTLFGAFAKLRKTTNSFMSVRPSVRMEQLNSHQMDFHELLYLGTFRKTVGKIQVSLKSDKNNGYFT